MPKRIKVTDIVKPGSSPSRRFPKKEETKPEPPKEEGGVKKPEPVIKPELKETSAPKEPSVSKMVMRKKVVSGGLWEEREAGEASSTEAPEPEEKPEPPLPTAKPESEQKTQKQLSRLEQELKGLRQEPEEERAPMLMHHHREETGAKKENMLERSGSFGIEDKVEQFARKEEKRFGKQTMKVSRRSRIVRVMLWLVVLGGMGGGAYAAVAILPRVEITVVTKKTTWSFVDTISASTVAVIDAAQRQVPAEMFSRRQNFSYMAPATGREQIEDRAEGAITIYNNYSSQPQSLVKSTRFETADGKLFLLKNRVVVPGATINQGQVVPSSVTARVEAAEPGEAYNIGAVEKFTIPGFGGTPKFNGFYAESKEPMKGGYVGERAYATEEDQAQLRERGKAELQETIETFLAMQAPNDFIAIEDAKRFEVIEDEMITEVDEQGNFSYFIDAEVSMITFRKADVMNLLSSLAKQELGEDFALHEETKLEYTEGDADFDNGTLLLKVDFQGSFEQPIEENDFSRQVQGKNERELKEFVYALPRVERATISFWPFWVTSVPKDPARVDIKVQ